MSRLRAVFFDLGGTLFSNLDIPRICMPVLAEAARRLGIEDGLPAFGPVFLQATQNANAEFVGRSFYMHRDLFEAAGYLLAQTFSPGSTREFVTWLYEAQRSVMISQLTLRPDCLPTLEALRERGLQLSIVSNIDDDFLEPMLDNLGLRAVFDHWISSEAARSCKPDPGIFRQALTLAGCRPDEVLFVGDSRVHDIQGARAIGIESVLIEETGGRSHLDDENHESEPDHVIGSLSELLPIVDAIRSRP